MGRASDSDDADGDADETVSHRRSVVLRSPSPTSRNCNRSALIKELKALGITAKELAAEGHTVQDLKKAGFSLKEVLAAGHLLAEAKAAGVTKALRGAGIALAELKKAGYTLSDFKSAGYVLPPESHQNATNACAPRARQYLTCPPAQSTVSARGPSNRRAPKSCGLPRMPQLRQVQKRNVP